MSLVSIVVNWRMRKKEGKLFRLLQLRLYIQGIGTYIGARGQIIPLTSPVVTACAGLGGGATLIGGENYTCK